MSRLIDGMHDHIIVCGVGSTGSHVVAELVASHTPLVAVDIDLDRIERVATELGQPQLPHVHGNATEDHVLEAAGIRRARGLIAALHEDRDNLFVTVTARALSDRLRIVAKAVDHDNTKKLARAGADSVVAPAFIGGVRLASEMVRPSVVQFLDAMTRDPQQHRRIEEFPVRGDSPVLGRTLGDVAIRDVVDGLVIAVRYQDGHHEYNPPPSTVLQPGVVLIVLVVTDEIEALRTYLAGG